MLEISGLNKNFNGITAIDNLDYSISDGSMECIIGPNGAGKSTLFNLITGAITADSGSIQFNGTELTDKLMHEIAQLGIVRKYQTATVFEELTVKKNFEIATQSMEKTKTVNELLEKFGLASEVDSIANELDQTEKQWLEIGMIYATDPELMLVDEPTSGLSRSESEEIADLLIDINEEGITTIVIEHDLDLVRYLDTNVTVLHKGSELATGDMDTIEANERVQEVYIGGDV